MVQHGKPAPDIFLLAAKTKGYNVEDCIVIGDSVNDFAAANAAGIKSIAFIGAEGNDTAEYRNKCITSGVVAVCSTMQEVKQTINIFADGANLFDVKDASL
jgi:beta-phosphoglucomutase-like phosphatase (HAD superfamily)